LYPYAWRAPASGKTAPTLSKRSRHIGVRGTYTAEVLARVGVRNTVVIGCPSHFINPLPTRGSVVAGKLRRGVFGRLAVTAGDLRPGHQNLERKLFGWLLQREGAYVCQSHPHLVSLARNRRDELTTAEVDQIRRYLQPRPVRLLPRSKFLATARQCFRVFFDAGAWLEFLTGFDLAVGARLHGNLLAVQAATPGVCIHHDARTQELCRTTGLPNVSVKDFLSARHPRHLVALTAFDGNDFDRKRAALARDYRKLLVEGGVEVSDQLTKLAEPG
jgi:hypothetical protein